MTRRRSNLFAVPLVGGLWLLTPGATLSQEPQAPDVSEPLPLGQAILDADGDFVPDRIGQRARVPVRRIESGQTIERVLQARHVALAEPRKESCREPRGPRDRPGNGR